MSTRMPLPLANRAVLLAALLFTPSLGRADGGGSAPPSPSPAVEMPRNRPPTPEEQAALDAQRAEELYATAYREVEKARRELADAEALEGKGETKRAEKMRRLNESALKRLSQSAGRFREVTELDPKNADAWNMLGYSLRMTGRTEDAFKAYWRCLELEPEHAGAHEYLGETYLAKGDVASAVKEQEWLERRKAPEAAILAQSIAKWRAANPARPAAGRPTSD